MRRHPALAVHERRAVRLSDDGEKLVKGVERIYGQNLAREVFELPRFEDHDVPEVDAHSACDDCLRVKVLLRK
jgi:hypothetical protein